MGWTSKQQQARFPWLYSKNSNRVIPGKLLKQRIEKTGKEISDDSINRSNVVKEIEKRCNAGENLDEVAKEIAKREEIKQQFSYFEKNGITTPLYEMFKNWYIGKQKNKNSKSKMVIE